MLSARRLPNACPRCRARVLQFYESAFPGLLAPTNRSRSIDQYDSALALRPAAARHGSIKAFSTTRLTRQGAQPRESPTGPEDIEAIVRHARQTFGNTLPPGYLSEEEYRIYERLYGPPVRETQPEDVGIPFPVDDGVEDGDPSKNILLKENEFGSLEEVEYTLDAQPETLAVDEQDPSDEDALEEVSPLTEGQIDYLSVKANNQREYDALVKLQRDFEAASLRAVEEEIEDEPEENEEGEEEEGEEEEDEVVESLPVYYTHLTLPTKA